jgi:hypothetical protein
VMSHESKRDFGVIMPLFSVTLLSSMQLENNRVMLPKFRSDLLLITNSCFIDHPYIEIYRVVISRNVLYI